MSIRALVVVGRTAAQRQSQSGRTAAVQAWRSFGSAVEDIEDDIHEPSERQIIEKEKGFKVDFKAAEKQGVDPVFWEKQKNAKWWHPDPVSGVWVPEDKFGLVDSAQLREQHRSRASPPASMDERAWWSSLEELPDEYNRPSRSRR